MRVIRGRGIYEEIAPASFTSRFGQVEIDLGCGDGRRLYRLAGRNPDVLYVGVDALAAGLAPTAARAARKSSKGGRENLLLVVAAVEDLPADLPGLADRISVILPWGGLLSGLLKAEPVVLRALAGLARPAQGASFDICLSCSHLLEAVEMERRSLPVLSKKLFLEELSPLYAAQGLVIESVTDVDSAALRRLDTSWAKRLAANPGREVFSLKGFIQKDLKK